MTWNSIQLPEGGRLFKAHNFTFMYKGSNFTIEVDEFSDGTFSGHAEHARDKNLQIESVSGRSVEHCMEQLIKKIQDRA